MRRVRRPVAVVETTTQAKPAGEPAGTSEAEGLWGVALMRVAFELKRDRRRGLPEIIERVTAKMGLPKKDLERLLDERFGGLETLSALCRRSG